MRAPLGSVRTDETLAQPSAQRRPQRSCLTRSSPASPDRDPSSRAWSWSCTSHRPLPGSPASQPVSKAVAPRHCAVEPQEDGCRAISGPNQPTGASARPHGGRNQHIGPAFDPVVVVTGATEPSTDHGLARRWRGCSFSCTTRASEGTPTICCARRRGRAREPPSAGRCRQAVIRVPSAAAKSIRTRLLRRRRADHGSRPVVGSESNSSSRTANGVKTARRRARFRRRKAATDSRRAAGVAATALARDSDKARHREGMAGA